MHASLLILVGALFFGQATEPRVQAAPSTSCWGFGLPHPSRYEGVIWVCPADVEADPVWADQDAAAPVPLTVDEAIATSHRVLSKLYDIETQWRVRAISLTRIFTNRWVYEIEWEVPGSDKVIKNIVTLSGKVVDKVTKRP
jgi:hypothetical protein